MFSSSVLTRNAETATLDAVVDFAPPWHFADFAGALAAETINVQSNMTPSHPSGLETGAVPLNVTGPNLPAEDAASVAPAGGVQQKLAASLNRAELLAAIDYEIEQMAEENKRPGWSTWALQGGIATLCWLALADFSSTIDFQTVGKVFLFACCFGDFATAICYYCYNLDRPTNWRTHPRFSTDDPTITAAELLFHAFNGSLLLSIYFWLAPSLSIHTFVLYCSIYICASVVVLPIRLIKILPSGSGLSGKATHLTSWLMIAWSGYICYQLFRWIALTTSQYNPSEFRIGLLLAGVLYLFSLLAGYRKQAPIHRKLMETRRELAFGRIGVEEALEAAEYALFGMAPVAVLRHRIREATVAQKLATAVNERLLAECQVVEVRLNALDAEGAVKDEKWTETARATALLIDACEVSYASGRQSTNSAFYKTKWLMQWIERAKKGGLDGRQCKSEWDELIVSMNAMEKSFLSAKEFIEKIKKRFLGIPNSGGGDDDRTISIDGDAGRGGS